MMDMSFKPIQGHLGNRRQVNLSVSEDEFDQIKAAAEKAKTTVSGIVRPAVFFALDHMEDET